LHYLLLNHLSKSFMFLKLANEGKNEFWRYLVTISAVIVGAVLGGIPLLVAIVNSTSSQSILLESLETGDFSDIGIDTNYFLVLLLLQFVVALLVLWIMVKTIHQKVFLAVTTARKSLDWKRISVGFLIWFALLGVLELVAYWQSPNLYVYQLEWESFLPLLAIAFFLLPLQTSAEELFMRGYLMQGISLLFAYRWVPLVITSVIFGLLHYANPEVTKYGFWVTMPGYIGIGLALAVMTLMDDGLELALGVHAANNIYSAVVVTFDGSALSTPAMFKVLEINPLAGTILTLVISSIFIYIVSKIYGWKDWRKIYGKKEDIMVTNH